MDLTSVVAVEATYETSNTQWNLAFLTRERTPVLFFVDFDHAHAHTPEELGWGSAVLEPFQLAFAPGSEWKSDHAGRWSADVRPRRESDGLVPVG
jgi:hypothetical protein